MIDCQYDLAKENGRHVCLFALRCIEAVLEGLDETSLEELATCLSTGVDSDDGASDSDDAEYDSDIDSDTESDSDTDTTDSGADDTTNREHEFLLTLFACLTPKSTFIDQLALHSAALNVLLLVCSDKRVLKQAIDLGMAPAISTLHLLDSLIPELLPYDANRSLQLLLELMLPYDDDPHFLGLLDESEIHSLGLETALDNHLSEYSPPIYKSIREIDPDHQPLWIPPIDFLERNFVDPLVSFYVYVLHFLQSSCIYPTAFRPLLLASLNFSLFRQEKGDERSITLSSLRQSIWHDPSLLQAIYYSDEMPTAEIFFILTRVGVRAPLAIDWSQTIARFEQSDRIHQDFIEILSSAVRKACMSLLPPAETPDSSTAHTTLTRRLREHLTPLLQPSWLESLLKERELLHASGASIVEHWIDLAATLLAPNLINPLVKASQTPEFQSSIQLDGSGAQIPTFNVKFMPSVNAPPQLLQVEDLIRRELCLEDDSRITYLMCRDLDTAVLNLTPSLEWDDTSGSLET